MPYARVGIVTGANKGIGLAIVRQLALQYPPSPLNGGPFLIYLTARDTGRGEAAVKSLHHDNQLQTAKALTSAGGLTDIKFRPLDITASESIQSIRDFIKEQHPDGIDFLVNNAAVALDGFNDDVVEKTFRCNYYGTLEMTQAFIPLLKPSGRIINVASTAGSLGRLSTSLQERFRGCNTVPEATALMEDFADAVRRGKEREEGWLSAAYATSKAGEIAMTRAIAAGLKSEGNKSVLVNSCCPGYVNTDMTKHRGTKTPDQGAQTPVMLALEDIDGQSGLFWSEKKPVSW